MKVCHRNVIMLNNPKLHNKLKLTQITHGEYRGFWVLYRPGRQVADVQYGGKPLVIFKFGGYNKFRDKTRPTVISERGTEAY